MVVFMKNILADNCYFRGRRWDDEHAVKAMVFFILTVLRLLSYFRNFVQSKRLKRDGEIV